MDRSRFWLALPASVLAALDVTLTLAGQGPGYWAGDFGSAIELNPLGLVLLRTHPIAFALAGAAWSALLFGAVGRSGRGWALALAFAAALGHAIGGAGWLGRVEGLGIGLAIAYLLAAGLLADRSWRRAGWSP